MLIPWCSGGYDSLLPLQRAQVRSLVGELRFHMHISAAKQRAQSKKNGTYLPFYFLINAY